MGLSPADPFPENELQKVGLPRREHVFRMCVLARRLPAGILYGDFCFAQRSIGRCGRNQASSAGHKNGRRFPTGRIFLAELETLAIPSTIAGTFAVYICCQPSVELTALESRQRRCGRNEFCDFLVCPEFPLSGVCFWMIAVSTAAPGRTPEESVKRFTGYRRPLFADAVLIALTLD